MKEAQLSQEVFHHVEVDYSDKQFDTDDKLQKYFISWFKIPQWMILP